MKFSGLTIVASADEPREDASGVAAADDRACRREPPRGHGVIVAAWRPSVCATSSSSAVDAALAGVSLELPEGG